MLRQHLHFIGVHDTVRAETRQAARRGGAATLMHRNVRMVESGQVMARTVDVEITFSRALGSMVKSAPPIQSHFSPRAAPADAAA
jgi:hypothetical protein